MESVTVLDESLRLTIEPREDQLVACIEDQVNGLQWGPVRLFDLEVYCKDEFRAVRESCYCIDELTEVEPGRIHVTVRHARFGIRVGLWFWIDDGELVVRMPIPEVYEDRAQRRLFSVILLPELMQAGSSGEMLLPLNTGCLSFPKDKPKLRDRFMIYGEQPRWELVPMLPVCAVMNPNGGLMAMATGAAAETECHVATDGHGSGTLDLGMSLRQFWPDPVEWETREIRYRPIAAEADLLQCVGKRLRRHIIEDLGKRTLKQRIAESPELAYTMDSYTMKLFFAVENNGIMMAGKEKKNPITFQRAMTFAEAEKNLRLLHKIGIEKIYTQSVGWNANGHDGLYPSRLPVEERLGGEAAFRRLNATGRELGYLMNIHDNGLQSLRRSPDFDEEEVVHDQWGLPMGLGEWGGGITHKRNINLMSDQQLRDFFRQVKDLGLEGMGYLDGMGNPLYRDYHPRHRLSRTGYADMTNRLIRRATDVHGACGTECGFLYCAIAADSVVTGGSPHHWKACWEEWPITHLMDKRVPLYRLALSGLVFQECQRPVWSSVMESVLFGLHPRDEWGQHPGPLPVFTDKRAHQLKAVYDIALKRFGHLQAKEILSWKEDNGVQTTVFSDDTEVIADFTEEELIVNGETIVRPDALK